MSEIHLPFFGKSRAVERQIEEFLDSVSEVGILFIESVRDYVQNGLEEDCLRRQARIGEVERHCDDLRRSIESVMLTQMLIPQSRGDVLRLIDLLDDLVDDMKRGLLAVTIEMPKVPYKLKPDVGRLRRAIHVVRALQRIVDHQVVVRRAIKGTDAQGRLGPGYAVVAFGAWREAHQGTAPLGELHAD